jgi:formamidopyrimidine-DNA glycosylase
LPELPDIAVYIEALEERILGQPIDKVRLASPFLVRSYDPPLRAIEGKTVRGLRRIGKRIVWELDEQLFVVIHLMVAGRLKLKKRGTNVPKRLGLCAFDFPDFTMMFTEASKKKRASLYIVRGDEALADHDPGGIDVMDCTLSDFEAALTRENHTLKRTMTDPHVFSGIGNAYSDEILHRAKLSPIKWTTRLTAEEIVTLHEMTQAVLAEWLQRLRSERGTSFPEKVTAFHDEMAVHGKYKQPCPACGTKVQRIVRGASEINYCPTCQTNGKLLADRALSRLLRGDWPKTLEELDERKAIGRDPTATRPPKKTRARKTKVLKRPATPKLVTRATSPPLLLFAHGAGASSASTWMGTWARRLDAIGRVVRFDYTYAREGRKRPDRHDKLVATHREVLASARARLGGKTVLIGKSMGGRMGCHVSLEEDVDALVCLGYPLVSPGKTKKVRDEVLVALKTPVLFVQGTRDKLCPLDLLADVRERMSAPNELHVVDTGDHSLLCTKTWLKQNDTDQDAVDAATIAVIDDFITRQTSP